MSAMVVAAVLVFCSLSILIEAHNVNLTEYYRMPTIDKFDHYNECFGLFQEKARYCFVRTYIKPNHSSELYNYIAEFSSNWKQHLRHDKLNRGICINNCMKKIQNLGKDAEKYFVDEFEMDTMLNNDFVGFENVADDRAKYNRIVNQCINIELMESYHLAGFSSIEYCTNNKSYMKKDWLDSSFIILLCSLLFAVGASSAYDRNLCSSQTIGPKDFNHYKKAPKALHQRIKASFSIIRNWYLLSAPVSQDMVDLKPISAIRIWSMMLLIYGHCLLLGFIMPRQDSFAADTGIDLNGGLIVQTFFVISGFLNTVVLYRRMDTSGMRGIKVWVIAILHRYFRFVPVLLVLMLFNATYGYRLGSGPFWNHLIFAERKGCRLNMWKNLLFINNYSRDNLKCMRHTWFLACEFYLGILGTSLLIAARQKPKYRNLILFGSLAISFLVSFVDTFLRKFEPMPLLGPESRRNNLYNISEHDSYYYLSYTPTHLNMGNFLVGLVVGVFYYNLQKSAKKHQRNIKCHILWNFSWICMTLLIFASGTFFYHNDLAEVWMSFGHWMSAFIASFMGHFFGFLFSIFLVGIFFGYGNLFPRFCNYGMYRILGRLSFSVYMSHLTVAKLTMGRQKFPGEISGATTLGWFSSVYLLSTLAALVVVLFIEFPFYVFIRNVLTIFDEPLIINKETILSEGEKLEDIIPGIQEKKFR